jgi:hypothetical protein
MAYKYTWLAAAAIIFSVLSCSPDRFSATRPVYFSIPDYQLETDYGDEGTSNSSITTAWIYVDNDLEGTYEVPFTAPVIMEPGPHTIRIFPGINLNGVNSTRAIYGFFERELFDTTLPADLDTFHLPLQYRRTNYTANTTVEIMEDFDEAGINLQATNVADTGIAKVSDPALVFTNPQNPGENNGRAGVMYTNSVFRQAEVASVRTYNLPKNGDNVYLEMNYRCNQAFLVGVIANQPGGTAQQATVVVNPKEVWNKIYINLVTELTAFQGADNFKIFIGTLHDSKNDTGWVYLDNLKLVY